MTDLESVLRAHQGTCLILLRIATSGVVLSTVRCAADADQVLIVIEDCCADTDEEVHRILIHKVFPRQGTVGQAQAFLQALGPWSRKALAQEPPCRPRPEAEGRPHQACVSCRALSQGKAVGAGARQGSAGGPGRRAV